MRALNPLSSSLPFLRAIAGNPSASSSSLLCSTLPQSTKRGDLCSSAINTRRLSSLGETLLEYERDEPCDYGKVMEKETTLHFALSKLVGNFDRESNLSLHQFFRKRRAHAIPTGSLKLDLALGIGGLPKGRMVEIYGKEASGKTTLALHIVKEAQKLGGNCAYLDVENALDHCLAEAMGVKTEKLLIAHPNSAENSLSIVNTLVNSGSIDVIVVDSVAALVPQCELDGAIHIHSQEVQSRLMTRALHRIHDSLSRSQTLIVFVNQVRSSVRSNQDFNQTTEVTCGGNALKFYAAIRMRTARRALLHTQDKVTGIRIAVEVVKNKLAPPMKTASLDIGFGQGIRRGAEILDMASRHGILKRQGGGIWIKREFFNDQEDAERYLEENDRVADELVGILRTNLFRDDMK